MSDANPDDLLYFNGINGANGDYEAQPLTLEALAKIAAGEKLDEQELKELKEKHNPPPEHFAPIEGVDRKDLSSTGWGVIFAFADKDKTPAIKEALKPLLDHRRAQAAKVKEHYYKEYDGAAAYRPNESKNDFLTRHGAGPGPADPDKVPYYLLIVGDPEAIPYRVQFQLDVQYAVGRIYFDTLEEYAAYAQRVVQAETQAPFLPRRATFFNVSNPGDKATQLSAEKLIAPLAASLKGDKPDWQIDVLSPADSTKARLGSILNNGTGTPSLLFTASHGMGFPNGDPRQLPHGGALLCQDWPGPQKHRGPIPESFYFSADDVSGDANLLGLMAFFFACYGAGTPKLDEFAHKTGQRAQIAPHSFLARLPRKLLTRGALAVVGHVERAWGTSFIWGSKEQIAVFESSFKRLMEGHPIGSAFEYFNERYAELSSDLSTQLEEIQFGAEVDQAKLASAWTANNDARSYVVIGDPATRMPVPAAGAAPTGRPSLAAVSLPAITLPSPPPRPSAPTPPSAGAPAEGEVDYGIGESFSQAKENVQQLIRKLLDTLNQVVDDLTSLEVKTYVSRDLGSVKYDAKLRDFTNADLRAMTRIQLDGDTLNVVPERSGQIDEKLWAIHEAMVVQAQANRAEMLKTAVSLLGSLKGL
jgi:hypothetical protein